MKIVQFLIGGGMGGAEMFFVRLGRALHQRGIEHHMVLTENEYRERYLLENGVPYTVVDFRRWHRWKGKRTLHQVVQREKPDVIVSWMSRAGRNTPLGKHATIGRIGNFYHLTNYARCDVIVANSPELVAHVEKSGRPEVRMIANFVELTGAAPVDRSAIARPLVFAAGRLHEQKGFDVLVRALAQTDAHLWIAGKGGAELEPLKSLAAGLGISDRVEFLGWQENVASLLAAADLVVMPSRMEGTSNALLEAMAAAKPIVTTAGQSVSWFLDDGVHAAIVPVNDAVATAAAMNSLIADPHRAERLGQAARDRYNELFGEEAICRQWIALFEDAVAGVYPRQPWWKKWLRGREWLHRGALGYHDYLRRAGCR